MSDGDRAERAEVVPAFVDRTAALDWLDAERDNLIAAVRDASGHGSHPTAWLLVDALRGYLWRRGHLGDWLAISRIGLAAAETAGDLTGQTAMWQSLGHASHTVGRYEQAEECLIRALELSGRVDWWQGRVVITMNLGIVHSELGRKREAVEHHTRALDLLREHGDCHREAICLHNLGNDYLNMGQLQAAVDTLTRALHLASELDNGGSGEVSVLQSLGVAQHALGRLDRALDLSTRALSRHGAVGSRREEVRTLAELAAVHTDLGDHRHALDLAHAAAKLAREIGETRAESEAVMSLAAVHHALDITKRCGFEVLDGLALTALAGTHLRAGRSDEAETYARRARGSHRRTGHRVGQARALTVLGLTARDRDFHRRAALDVYADLGVSPHVCQSPADLLV